MGFALSHGISYREIDSMSLDDFELAVDCLQIYLNNGKEKKEKVQDLGEIPSDESRFDFFVKT